MPQNVRLTLAVVCAVTQEAIVLRFASVLFIFQEIEMLIAECNGTIIDIRLDSEPVETRRSEEEAFRGIIIDRSMISQYEKK